MKTNFIFLVSSDTCIY